MDQTVFFVVFAIALVVIILIAKTAVVVPQQNAYIVELLGRYSKTLSAGVAPQHPIAALWCGNCIIIVRGH